MVHSLVASHVEINLESNQLYTPLSLSCYYRHHKIVVYLLENGADPNLVNIYGKFPLHIAVEQEHIYILQILIHNSNIDLEIKDNHGNTAFLLASLLNNTQLAQELAESNVNMNA